MQVVTHQIRKEALGTHSGWKRPLCPEAEPPMAPLHRHLREANRAQTPAQSIRIDRRVSVTQMNHLEE